MNMQKKHLLLSFVAICLLLATTRAVALNWPTYQHDTHRSGVTEEQLELPLTEKWVYSSPFPPQPAWEGPARWDSYSVQKDLKSMRNFDPVFYVTALGNRVFFGSSVDDAVHCLDAVTGKENWSLFTDGPVRFVPTCYKDKVYFGSDDGFAYCADAKEGTLVWQYQASPQPRLIPSNGKLISINPVRTGVLVMDGIAYFGASLLPWRESYLCAVDADTGADTVDGAYRIAYENLTLQGAMLASQENLCVLQGRIAPIVFERVTGKRRRIVNNAGGVFALLTEDEHLIAAPGSQKEDLFAEKDASYRDKLAFYPEANRIVVSGEMAYLQSRGELAAFNRRQMLAVQKRMIQCNESIEELEDEMKKVNAQYEKDRSESNKKKRAEVLANIKALKKEIKDLDEKQEKCFPWKVSCSLRHNLILAGNILFAGGTDKVVAYDTATGTVLWETTVAGAAHGLTVANGRLFISTDRGHIYAFE